MADELYSLGLPEKLINWTFNFLNNRHVFVKFQTNLYGPQLSNKGVCQGGILIPLLFILYIDKLNNILGIQINNLQYANDLTVYCAGKTMQVVEHKLNLCINKIKDILRLSKVRS